MPNDLGRRGLPEGVVRRFRRRAVGRGHGVRVVGQRQDLLLQGASELLNWLNKQEKKRRQNDGSVRRVPSTGASIRRRSRRSSRRTRRTCPTGRACPTVWTAPWPTPTATRTSSRTALIGASTTAASRWACPQRTTNGVVDRIVLVGYVPCYDATIEFCVLLGFTGFFYRFYWVFTEWNSFNVFYWVLTGFYGVFIRLYWVLLGFIGLIGFLLSWTEFQCFSLSFNWVLLG